MTPENTNALYKLRLTYVEGIFYAAMVATSESYALYRFAKSGASPLEIGLISTVPVMVAATSQLILPRFIRHAWIEWGILFAILVQILGLTGIVLEAQGTPNFWYLLTALTLYWVGGQSAAPLWLDWIAKLCPEKNFPRYLSRRNGFINILVMLCYLGLAPLVGEHISFVSVFVIGLGARLISFVFQAYLALKDRTVQTQTGTLSSGKPLVLAPDVQKTLYSFFLWNGLFRFAANLGSPFFLPYMVNDLKLSTTAYVALTATPLLGRALFLQNWGRASEGTRPFWGVQLSCVFISFLPIMWNFGSSLPYLIVLQILSGIFWGGMEMTQVLMVQNFAYGKARRLLGRQQALLTVFSVLGAAVGGIIIKQGYSIPDIFVLSTVVRLAVAGLFIANASRFQIARLTWSSAGSYLTTVLSLRASPANIGRVLPSERDQVGK